MSSDIKKMGISVTILGSGTCVPSLGRSSCSVLMEAGETKMLFDCGPGVMRQLLKAGTSIFDISFLFLSHFHPDHSGELVSFLFSNKYAGSCPRKTPLTIAGGKGFSLFYKGLKAVYGHWMELEPELLNIIEFGNTARECREFSDFTVETMPVKHSPESIAHRITSGGKSVVYSGDTDFSDSLAELAENADLLICESAFPDALKVGGHLTPSLAGEIAARANVRKLLLTHFYPECDKTDIEKECRRTYNGDLLKAEDLMKICV
ncbi:MAG: MBL fold metallo-hydrolase [Desulfobacteraceae bacterium 4572_88]|nr:MAG: MBL fold metallo-hydrolase [Desulfobacteraceae bacterium 4572_88]